MFPCVHRELTLCEMYLLMVSIEQVSFQLLKKQDAAQVLPSSSYNGYLEKKGNS